MQTEVPLPPGVTITLRRHRVGPGWASRGHRQWIASDRGRQQVPPRL